MSSSSSSSTSSLSPSFRFATLIPENPAAQKCLASLVDQQQLLIQQSPGSGIISPIAAIRASPAALSTATHRAAQSRYQLDLSFDNDNPGRGQNSTWVVGKFVPKTAAAVDLPICSSRSRQFKGAKVCEIFIHPQSGALVLRNINASHSIFYLQANGASDVELQYRDEYVLYMTTNHLRIGPLDFILTFSVDNERAYSTSRDNYMRTWYRNWGDSRVHDCLDPLPRPTHWRIGNIIIHRTISRGAFGVVRIGVDKRSGDVVACKTIHCRHCDVQAVSNEIDIASKIRPHTIGLVPLLGSSCEHGQSPPCFQTALEDVHLFMPYAPFSFQTTAWYEMPMAKRLALFRQVLEGLRNLHTVGIIHRDISPNNLLVFSHHPPAAAICDFGKSKQGIKGTQIGLGPLAFTAPEVGRQREYTNAIDVFSMGLSMLSTFKKWESAGPLSCPDNYARVLQHLTSLQGRVPDDLGALLRFMLAWDPADRPTAEQALAFKVWDQVDVAGPESETQSSGESSAEPGPSSTEMRLQRSGGPSLSGLGGTNKRIRRSDAPTPSRIEVDSNTGKKTRISGSSGFDGREKRLRRSAEASRSLLSPPPA